MTCTSAFIPAYLAQNPAISKYVFGWASCAAFAGAEAASYATCGTKHPTGAQVRNLTNEPIPNPSSPGLTIIQVADALAKLGITVTPFTRLAWSAVQSLRAAGHGISLCGGYSVLRTTKYTGDPGFYGNHQVWYPPSGATMDPLCDGRRAGIYKYHGEVYPDALMAKFAAALRVNTPHGSVLLGPGWAQGFYTLAHPASVPVPGTHTLNIATGTTTIVIASVTADVPPKIGFWRTEPWSGIASTAPCGPVTRLAGTVSGAADCALVTAGVFAGKWVRIGGGTSVT